MTETNANPYQSPTAVGEARSAFPFVLLSIFLVLIPCWILSALFRVVNIFTATYGDFQLLEGRFNDLFDSLSGMLIFAMYIALDIVAPLMIARQLNARSPQATDSSHYLRNICRLLGFANAIFLIWLIGYFWIMIH